MASRIYLTNELAGNGDSVVLTRHLQCAQAEIVAPVSQDSKNKEMARYMNTGISC